MSSERRGVMLLLLDSMGTFRSALLWLMVAVRWRSVQREGSETNEQQQSGVTGMDCEFERLAAKAEERLMNMNELQMVLGYLNIGLAIAHNQGVTVGHFGSGDFIGLAETVNGLLLRAITPPATVAAPAVAAISSAAATAPVAVAATASSVAVAPRFAAVTAPTSAVAG